MPSPRYTIILPMLRYRADQPVLASLRANPPPGPAQIIVAVGDHPARQRNAALARAEGEFIVFFDNDCTLAPDFWSELETILTQPKVEIVGGPALLRPEAHPLERIFHALLTHVLIVGTVSARYAPRGAFRPATQTDLILCNLAARREVLAKIGFLSTDLYPNEENEWLDRAHVASLGAYYDPSLQVYRPQRSTWAQMGLTLLRYGMGRTRQFQVSGWHPTFHQFLPLMLIATFVALFYWQLEITFLILWLIASAIIALTCDSRLNFGERLLAGLVAPLIPLTYTVGQIIGWFTLVFPIRVSSPQVTLLHEQGQPLG